MASACIMLVAFRTGYWPMLFAIHLATFFFTALMCHQRLAARRPPPDRLTEFYLLMSFGGGLFALRQPSRLEIPAAFLSAGAAVGVALAGDLHRLVRL